MNEPSDLESNQNNQIGSIGERLRNAREAKHWSIEHVADRLHLSRQRVIDMENDEYKYASAETYAKGYIRGYAKLVGLSAEKLIEEFDRKNFASTIQTRKPQLIESKQAHVGDRSMRWATFAIVIGLLVMVGLWWNSQHGKDVIVDADANANQTTVEPPKKVALPQSDAKSAEKKADAPVEAETSKPDEEKQETTETVLQPENKSSQNESSPISTEALREG